jgi:hypothetical protein
MERKMMLSIKRLAEANRPQAMPLAS